jgi:DNA replication protein DnaC
MQLVIPKIFLNKPFTVEEGNKRAWETSDRLVKGNTQKGLLLFGGPGIGKTHLAAWTTVEWCKVNKTNNALFVNYPRLIGRMQYNLYDESYKNEFYFEDLATTKLLVLDDVGCEKTSEWSNFNLYNVINRRYENMKLTIITTNYNPHALANKIGDNLVSRLHEMCEVIEIVSDDKRVHDNF